MTRKGHWKATNLVRWRQGQMREQQQQQQQQQQRPHVVVVSYCCCDILRLVSRSYASIALSLPSSTNISQTGIISDTKKKE